MRNSNLKGMSIQERAEEVSSMSDAAAARLFASHFPTVTLELFHARRKGIFVVSHNTLHVVGAAAEMVRLGLLQKEMIPPGRKRLLSGSYGPKRKGSSWDVVRLKADRIKACFEIMGDDQDDSYYPKGTYPDDFPADHPLQMFHPRNWPFGDAPELRAYFECTRADAREWVSNSLAQLRRNLGHMSGHGYSVHPSDRAQMRGIMHEFGARLLAAFDNARIVSERAPQLTIVGTTHKEI